MLETKLETISAKLSNGELKLSDALLFVARFLNGKVPTSQLVWLNRELLGYLKEDLESIFTNSRSIVPPLAMPEYRFLNGSWGKAFQTGEIETLDHRDKIDKQVFCNIGIQQIETQLFELEKTSYNVFSMCFDPKTETQFYCYTDELKRLYQSVTDRLIRFIERSAKQLEGA